MSMNYSKKRQNTQAGKKFNTDSTRSNDVSKYNEIPFVEEWEKQIWFYRSHIDIFIEEYLSSEDKVLRLFPFQAIIARETGRCSFVDDVESRALGKTYKMSLILASIAILYPNSPILVVSKTVKQAMITIKYIETIAADNINLSREIVFPIQTSKDYGKVKFKSGSYIEAMAMNTDGSNIRGLRRKIIYIDESAWVKSEVIQSVLMPILQFKRDIYWKYKDTGFEDYSSKLIQTTSAYLKSCDFFSRFKITLKEMTTGKDEVFGCSLNFETGIKYGIIDRDFVESQKTKMPLSAWEMEWNSKFIGAQEGSYFPYELTEPCRTLDKIEYMQPRNSKTRYIISCDIATSAATYADNACICVIKMAEKTDGTFNKFLVYIRSYHGYQLEALAYEIRKTAIRFPNAEKVIIDINALGEGIVSLLNTPFVDGDKEYPPYVLDDTIVLSGNAIPILRGVRADNKYNARMATATRIFLENKSLHLPTSSVSARRELETDDSKKMTIKNKKTLLIEETAIFIETDALQYEMGNIVPKITTSGNILYDTQSQMLHKDRYVTLGMALEYIHGLEETNKELRREDEHSCLGMSYTM